MLFLSYPLLRPWHDEATVAGARESMGSTAWVIAHFLAMVGFVLVPIALLGMRERLGITSAVVMWVGAGLVLPYYGAEDFGLHAAANNSGDLLAVAEATRYHPLAVVIFGAGLVALALGAVLVAMKDRSAVLFAAGFVLFLPQFFTPAPVRIAHGVLMLAGLAWFAFKSHGAPGVVQSSESRSRRLPATRPSA
ncbi:hypothetical protein [Kibdelosporangium phytohabitans]|uniref:Uncharacterized protein n=1 Tax=Kibdelosporangium phytohabitans TaxID=860235 RepID=A0A0N9I1E7_9PSEU|nr:hypothetical protein [Kibdelosporangium phytohabitans]ALG08260.1 hypothetical protein AOZ06_16275 [Kibdelosporangium phytohabitans]MBE1470727.1 hypothetical protein [Kibdelosporangium phytohabitans]